MEERAAIGGKHGVSQGKRVKRDLGAKCTMNPKFQKVKIAHLQ